MIDVPGDYPSIQTAIGAASDGDVVCVAAGTYQEQVDLLGKAITVTGVTGGLTVIDAGGFARPVSFETSEGPDSILQGFTIRNGVATDGGCVSVTLGASPTLRDLVVEHCTATGDGGGLCLRTPAALLQDVTVRHCTAGGYGGGIAIPPNFAPRIEGGEIHDNVADIGGGIAASGSGATELIGIHVHSNTAASMGGGVFRDGGGGEIADCLIEGNQASSGAGMVILNGDPLVHGVTVTGNTASGGTGGISLSDVQITLTDSEVTSNTSTYGTGGLSVWYGNETTIVELERVLVSGNSTGGDGGGITIGEDVVLRASGCTIVANTAGCRGGGVFQDEPGPPLSYSWLRSTTIAHNHADGLVADDCGGGGAWVTDLQLEDVLIAGNTTTASGGGIYGNAWNGLENAIVCGNQADGEGGGIYHPGTNAGGQYDNVAVVGNGAGSHGGGFKVSGNVHLVNVLVSHNTAGGQGGGLYGAITPDITYCDVWGNTPTDHGGGLTDMTGWFGNVSTDPQLLGTSAPDPLDWDLHLAASSPLVDAGDPGVLDPDGSFSDIGAYGGPDADGWDLDWDGYFEWWLPGPYDAATSPGADCDDQDGTVFPGNGC